MTQPNEPIAVIGSGCRFPGEATSPSKLWGLLRQPRDVLSKIDRFRADNFYNVDGHHHGASNVRESYQLSEDPRAFDAQFFGIQGGEADCIDPQQRLLLETIYESLESAGQTIEALQGSPTAVYVGVMCDDYAEIVYHDTESIPTYAATGSARSIMSNRISYFFDWKGPSMTIDTACSSSLVAVHQAAQVLRSGESRVAIAAGANLIFGPKMYIAESNLNMLSPTGRSRMWDANADGYARGEGIASVVLKTLSAALADGDTIECLIRETGVNQDGRTTGITMPSSAAQASLIRQTYARAGLDLTKQADRPQFFEAHGTGTKAGDPQEARAIHEAFFSQNNATGVDETLFVGSIKTVIGHTEGTAGIAGLLKASMAIRNKVIPPNMHFNTLNPDLEPFYDRLQVPTAAQAWPTLTEGGTRRASVNSFGFGGTNAHAIIENYEPNDIVAEKAGKQDSAVATPFTFSAISEKSLVSQLQTYTSFLRENPGSNLREMSLTLSRRSAFPFRASFSGLTTEGLASKVEAKLEEKSSGSASIATRPITKHRGILGVFTGQGAQWAAMGKELIMASKFAEGIVDELERSLAELPAADRPPWSLKSEMLAPAASSRISKGEFSQPLCTAVQILLVDLLHQASIDFDNVVGHSSGEIAASYAAGFISARDAIRIAYYRGVYSKLARGPDNEPGAMLAAGTSMEDAGELCALPDFEGKLQVAASNSSSSITFSGNVEAVEQAKEILEDEGKFARLLKVDTAYHSHHMHPCSGPYQRSLENCNIKVKAPSRSCSWFSSVLGGQKIDMQNVDDLKAAYWMNNMLKPVLFSQAVEAAVADSRAPAIALEVGPHPALKGPATMTMEDVIGNPVPYSGVLSRGNNDVEAFSDGLGFVWSTLGPAVVNFTSYDKLFSEEVRNTLSKDLPSYTWDHERTYWNETRESKAMRLREDATHELLGVRTADNTEGEYRWRNFLKPTEMPWLRGHQIQGQTLFPAAGFAAMAIESSRVLAPSEQIRLIELRDFSIHRALAFYDEAAGVETVFSLTNITTDNSNNQKSVFADFACFACQNKDSGNLTSMASGQLKLCLGEPSVVALPERPPPGVNFADVDTDLFYTHLTNLGYNYSDIFRAITSLRRTTDAANGTIHSAANPDAPSPFTLHPATLDVAFQSVFAAIGSPGDGRLWTIHVPTMINKISINPFTCPPGAGLGVSLPFDAYLSASVADGISGDVDIYDEGGTNAIVQVEGLHVTPLTTPTAVDDKQMFAETVWDVAEPDGEIGFKEWVLNDVEETGSLLVERTCLFYMKKLHDTITAEERGKCDWHQTRVLNWAAYTVQLTSEGRHPTCKKEWLNDTHDELHAQIAEMAKLYDDFNILVFVGERLIPFARGELSFIEQFRENNMLEHFYRDTYGSPEYNVYLGRIVKQIAHRYQHMNILEIGAGTGSSTRAALNHIGDNYSSYTYTDISAGFFEEAKELFSDHASKMIYQPLNAEHDPTTQGFPEHSYDMVIASNVLHATRSLEDTLKNARKLLRPGGFLILFEVTNNEPLRIGFMFSGIPGWWVGGDDNRVHSPLVSQKVWDSTFRKTGFSGIDTATPDSKVFVVPFSIMVTQAVDTQMNLIRKPLSLTGSKPVIENLLILGGSKVPTLRLIDDVASLLKPLCKNMTMVDRLEDLDMAVIASKPTVLSLTELDEPVFNPFTEAKFKAVQTLLDQSKNVLWIIQGSRGDRPYANMMQGVARCLVGEMPDLRLQYLDVDVAEKPDAKCLAENLLRLQISDSWKSKNEPYKPLWTVERELAVSKGCVEIPRYIPNDGPNDRFNSAKRLIRKDTSMSSTLVVTITSSNSSYDLQEYHAPKVSEVTNGDDSLTIEVSRSIWTALKLKSVGYLYIVIGVVAGTQQKVIAMSEGNRSVVSCPKSWTRRCTVSEDQESRLLLAIANDLLADAIIGRTKKGSSLLVHEPTPLLKSAVSRLAKVKALLVTYTSAKSDMSGVHRLHLSTPDRAIEHCIPKHVSVFVDFSGSADPNEIGARIGKHLPRQCKRSKAGALFNPQSVIRPGHSKATVWKTLQDSYARSLVELSGGESLGQVQEIALKDIPEHPLESGNLCTVNWTATTKVPVRILPAECDTQFRNDRTYFLIGLTGELGLSLCHWMVKRGAKYLALTSRKPNINQGWLNMIQEMGAVVKPFAMDVTDKDSVIAVHKVICSTMPPIAGVANAAMVLIDGLFINKTHEEFNKTLRAKVDGSIILDELFPGNDLDFFILFSSLASVTGNIGQTSYAAANAFMAALIAGRRKRGVVGSVMNLAGIFGLGYITRTDKGILDRLGNMGYANISEWDFHQFFAEAVHAGRPESGRSPELSAGLQSFDPENDPNAPAWLNIPKFSHYRRVKTIGQNTGGATKGSVSVKTLLGEQTSEEAVYQTLLDGLLSMLSDRLHLSAEDNISPETTIVELGVDSLVAVDLRSWFTNELGLDMPVLKILGGASVADLVEDAAKRLPAELVPNLVLGSEAKADPTKPIEEQPREDTIDAAIQTKEGTTESTLESRAETTESEGDKDGSLSTDSESSRPSTPPSVEAEESSTEISVSNIGEILERKDEAFPVVQKQTFLRTTKMSYGSSRFWFLRQYLEDPTTFNLLCRTKLSGHLKVADLERAVSAVGQRHEAFRTAFFANAEQMNEPTQGVLASSRLHLEKKSIVAEADAIQECESLMKHTFDLEQGESIRILLLSLNPTTHFLVFAFHHIAIDGFSFNLLLADLNKLYAGQSLPPVSCQFTDFAANQRKAVESGAMKGELEYWKNMFSTFPDPLPLFPMAKVNSRLPLKRYDYQQIELVLDSKTASQVRDTCRRYKSTTFHFFLAVLKIFLFRFLDIEDVCVGMADANRTESNSTGTIGFLLNLLPLRFRANTKQNFAEAIKEARDKAYSALAHSKLPFDVLLEELDIPRSSTHSPLFQVFMDYRQLAVKSPKMLGAQADGVASTGRTAYDLTLDVNEVSGDEIKIAFRTQKYLYSQSSTEILFKSYIRLVKEFSSSLDVAPSKVQLFDSADTKAAINLGRGRLMESVWPATIAHRIDDMVVEHGESVAVKDGMGNALTYSEMARRVDAISASLSKLSVSAGSTIAVFQEPSADWICSLLAIWKCGGVYVPLELRNGVPRLAIIVKDCQPGAIICHDKTANDVPALGSKSAKVVNVSRVSASEIIGFANKALPQAPAVILYTSGSTGVPKGIILRHSSIRNEMEGYSKEWNIGRETVLQQSAYSFDFSLDQMLSGLANGGTVYVVPESKRRDPAELANLINNEKITYTKATPSEYSSWLRYGWTSLARASQWRYAFGGGEALTGTLVQGFRDLNITGLRLLNSYGPGEVTISCTKAEIKYWEASQISEDAIPAGFPLPNYALYIVDRNMDPVPVGVTGEILIGGAGCAVGYLNNDKLTKTKFIPDINPSPEYASKGWTTVYKSGDMGHLRSDGALIFEGRIEGDTQIKLRGIRIELEDIENTIIEAAGGVICKAVCSVRGDPQFLVAHVEFSTTYPESEREQFLKTLGLRLPLPQYMRPARIIALDMIPLNSHSKTNRLAINALPLPSVSRTSREDVVLSETEQTLKKIWQEIVSKDIATTVTIDRDTDFFHVGGNSLLLVKLQAIIRETFNAVLPMVELFEASTLGSMATKIENASAVVAIDWEAETAVQADLIASKAIDSKQSVDSPRPNAGLVVLLTGATGFLGRHLLQQLDSDSRVSQIHCVAVRQNSDFEPRQLAIESDKITIHTGDLTESQLGLSDTSFSALARDVDVIIHSGANRSFWDYYQQLRPPNLASTKELARLASSRQIPIHFISSGGVLQLSKKENTTTASSMASFKPPVDGSMGYVASKWSSEAYLENASTVLGLPIHIHRVTPAAASSSATPELLSEFSDLADRMKTLPSQAGWTGTFDLIRVRTLAQNICAAALTLNLTPTLTSTQEDSEKNQKAITTFQHHESEIRLRMQDVAEHLEMHEGRNSYERLAPHKWVGKAKGLGIGFHFASQDFSIGGEGGEGGSGSLTLKR